LNTPRLVADATGTTVWRWDQQEAFGNNPADEDPDANSVAFDPPLRLPGQRYDKESGLHYNYFRDYDPSIGRYGESDPIGLDGGLNTYAYVEGSPLAFVDLKGLYKYSDPSVPRVTNPDMHNFLICLDQCTGKEQEVTSTSDGKHKDPGHALGTSVDIGPRGTPSRQLFCCSGRCGATFVLDERKHKTTYQTGPHYHIQLRPPSDRSKDAIPPECKPICL
jgi:RHS repeat-associated protein